MTISQVASHGGQTSGYKGHSHYRTTYVAFSNAGQSLNIDDMQIYLHDRIPIEVFALNGLRSGSVRVVLAFNKLSSKGMHRRGDSYICAHLRQCVRILCCQLPKC